MHVARITRQPTRDRRTIGRMNADDLRAKIQTGQAATETALRGLADRIERLPLSDAEVMNWLAPRDVTPASSRTP
jgi:hypothetical protein